MDDSKWTEKILPKSGKKDDKALIATEINKLIQQCWDADVNKRPSGFGAVKTSLIAIKETLHHPTIQMAII